MKIGIIGTGAGALRMLGGDGETAIKDSVATPPALTGARGRAWRCDLERGRRELGVSPERDGTLAHWVVEAPWAHPAWHSYSVALVHLRPMPDGRRTLFYLDDATHEIWVYAINPDVDRNSLIDTGIVGGHWLTPVNFAAQFIEIRDDLAIERVQRTVQDIIDGKLSPDTDWRSAWAQIYGDNMMKDRPNARPPRER